ncbi:MAG: hypothetical protein AAGA75_10340 [Cyanobacteria bacterium P01_E01_bin.6]
MPSNQDPRQSINPVDYEKIVDYFRTSADIDDSLTERLNIDQMFVLIDGILPIEACLYYQVLPLFLEGSRLNLGMVSPSDTAATDYVRRIVSYLNYSLVTRQISSEALRASLTAYLKHTDEKSKAQTSTEPSAASRRAKRLSDRENTSQLLDVSAQQTLVVDSPDALDFSEIELEPEPTSSIEWEVDDADTITVGLFDEGAPDLQTIDLSMPLTKSPKGSQDELLSIPVDDPPDDQSIALSAAMPDIPVLKDEDVQGNERLASIPSGEDQSDGNPDLASQEAKADEGLPLASSSNQPLDSPQLDKLPSSHRYIQHRRLKGLSKAISKAPAGLLRSPIQLEFKKQSASVEFSKISTLPAQELLEELLLRMIDQGIGRLYFEHHDQTGRVLWSEDGVLQSIVEGIEGDQFAEVIKELKALTHLPLNVSDKPIQVELERMYRQERILLRFRFVPTKIGEDATLQVLRGAALRFYQQQQLSRLSRDAITTAQTLQNKVNALRDRLLTAPEMSENQVNILPTLAAMIDQIEGQLDDLEGMVK